MWRNFVTFVSGAVASIAVAAPIDGINTRVHNVNIGTRVYGLKLSCDLIPEEGMRWLARDAVTEGAFFLVSLGSSLLAWDCLQLCHRKAPHPGFANLVLVCIKNWT